MGGTVRNAPIQEHLDADAVCVQCGTVNPEATLICKTCGNNLRDQRHLRLQAEQILVHEAPAERGKYVMSGLLTMFGVLLVVWAAMNVEQITEWMVGGGAREGADLAAFWTGGDAEAYEALSQQLEAVAPTAEEVQAIVQEPVAGDSVSGVYVIVVMDGQLGARPVGTAAVSEDGDELLFVARLGSSEIRGRAEYYGASLAAQWNDAALSMNGEYRGLSGVAMPQAGGVFECFGQTDVSAAEYSAMAYRIS